MQQQTLASIALEFLKSLERQLLFQLEKLKRVMGRYSAHHNPIKHDRDGAYHSWVFNDGSTLRADILPNGLVVVDI
jgi:hypothetical protein